MLWLIAICALSLLIIIHELGHYVCARIGGMHVDRFSVLGIGPVILRLFEYRGTEFVISAIPFGAYVHIVGMEPAELEHESPPPPPGTRRFRESPLWARILAIAGGPLANYVAAMALVVGVYGTAGMKLPVATSIAGFRAGSPAEAAGLRVGDVYLKVGDTSVEGNDPRGQLVAVTAKHLGETVDVTVRRTLDDSSTSVLTVPVALNPVAPALATDLADVGEWTPVPYPEAISAGIMWPLEKAGQQLAGLWAIIVGETEGKVGGPVAIAKAIKGSAERGALDLLIFSAFISTILGLFNLLPLPALDGGRLVFLFYEVVARRPANKALEERVHMVGMIALLALIAWATIGDVRGETTPVWRQAVVEFEAELANEPPDVAIPARP